MNNQETPGPTESGKSASFDPIVIQRRQIVDVRFDGKWAEIWFADGGRNPQRYDECCKTDMLNDCIDESGLCHHIYLHGIIGVWVEWKDDRPVKASLRLAG